MNLKKQSATEIPDTQGKFRNDEANQLQGSPATAREETSGRTSGKSVNLKGGHSK